MINKPTCCSTKGFLRGRKKFRPYKSVAQRTGKQHIGKRSGGWGGHTRRNRFRGTTAAFTNSSQRMMVSRNVSSRSFLRSWGTRAVLRSRYAIRKKYERRISGLHHLGMRVTSYVRITDCENSLNGLFCTSHRVTNRFLYNLKRYNRASAPEAEQAT